MSSLAAAKADNFYFPPDFDPKKHQSLNKYHGQHPLRERAAKLDQGILVIRFEIPFNIWCDKCGEHIAKGERFNAEKKAIGFYHSTKVLQFSMTHHCGCRITIQTDPKNAEYLVVEGARKKEESYSAADAEVIELPDEAEKERRQRDPLYRLEYQQGAKAQALSGAARLAALHDAADARSADPYSLNRAARAALRAAKRGAAALDAERAALGLPDQVALLPAAESDGLAAQVAFLTSNARADAGAQAKRQRILDQDIFASSSLALQSAAGAAAPWGPSVASAAPDGPSREPAGGTAGGARLGGGAATAAAAGPATAAGAPQPAAKRQARVAGTGLAPAAAAAAAAQAAPQSAAPSATSTHAGTQRSPCSGGTQGRQARTVHPAGAAAGGPGGAQPQPQGNGGSHAATAGAAAASGRPPPGAAALAAAAARAAAAKRAAAAGAGVPSKSVTLPLPGRTGNGGAGAASGAGGGPGGGGAAAAAAKRSLKERAAELQRRRLGPAGIGLAVGRGDL